MMKIAVGTLKRFERQPVTVEVDGELIKGHADEAVVDGSAVTLVAHLWSKTHGPVIMRVPLRYESESSKKILTLIYEQDEQN